MRDEMWGTSDARLGSAERGSVQLCELREAGSKGTSAAGDPGDSGRGAGEVVPGIRGALRQVWPAVDTARAIASRPSLAGVLFGSFQDATEK